MTPKIIALLLTLVANVVISMFTLAVIVIALNGYDEHDAKYGLIVWLVLALICTLLGCLAAFVLVRVLLHRHVAAVKAVLIAAASATIVGFVFNIICGFIGVGVAEFVRVNF